MSAPFPPVLMCNTKRANTSLYAGNRFAVRWVQIEGGCGEYSSDAMTVGFVTRHCLGAPVDGPGRDEL